MLIRHGMKDIDRRGGKCELRKIENRKAVCKTGHVSVDDGKAHLTSLENLRFQMVNFKMI